MEQNQFYAIIVVVCMVGGSGVLILLAPMPEGITPIIQTDIQSYIIVSGEFNFVDVYTWGSNSGSEYFDHQSHVVMDGIKYEIYRPRQDGNDYDELYRMSIWIQIDGNLTEHRFIVVEDITFNVEFRGLQIEILINKYV